MLIRKHITYSSFLFYVRDHHHYAAVFLPNHAPKIAKRVGHGTLGGYVRVRLLITVYVVGVYVTTAATRLVTIVTRQLDTTVIV